MKFTYAYKTADGARHEAAMDAPSREDVFAELRKQGIRAIKVVAADGSKANGEARIRRRTVATVAAAVAMAGAVAFMAGRSGRPVPTVGSDDLLSIHTRRQVIGDAAVIDKGIRTGWADVFQAEGDRFLASFAIPGVKAAVRRTSEDEIRHALGQAVKPNPGDTLEARQIKAMVEGMKEEARRYLAAGGSVAAYGQRLAGRQDEEIAIFKRVEGEVMKAQETMSEAEFSAFLDKRNDELRNLGIRPVTLAE